MSKRRVALSVVLTCITFIGLLVPYVRGMNKKIVPSKKIIAIVYDKEDTAAQMKECLLSVRCKDDGFTHMLSMPTATSEPTEGLRDCIKLLHTKNIGSEADVVYHEGSTCRPCDAYGNVLPGANTSSLWLIECKKKEDATRGPPLCAIVSAEYFPQGIRVTWSGTPTEEQLQRVPEALWTFARVANINPPLVGGWMPRQKDPRVTIYEWYKP